MYSNYFSNDLNECGAFEDDASSLAVSNGDLPQKVAISLCDTIVSSRILSEAADYLLDAKDLRERGGVASLSAATILRNIRHQMCMTDDQGGQCYFGGGIGVEQAEIRLIEFGAQYCRERQQDCRCHGMRVEKASPSSYDDCQATVTLEDSHGVAQLSVRRRAD